MANEWLNIQEIFERVRMLEKQVQILATHVGVELPVLPDPVVDALKAGRMIEAVKLHQHRTGDGLAESKAAVEAIKASLGI